MSEDFPFIAADGYLVEAAGWLSDLMLPSGHEDRVIDEDDACLEEAVKKSAGNSCPL